MSMSYSKNSKLFHIFYVFFWAYKPIIIFQVHIYDDEVSI